MRNSLEEVNVSDNLLELEQEELSQVEEWEGRMIVVIAPKPVV